SLGISKEKLTLTNNLKFEIKSTPDDILTAKILKSDYKINNRLVLVAGSTHEPEEQILLDAYAELKQDFPNLLLIIVPRHPQRFEKVHQLLQKQSINSELVSHKKPIANETQVLLCDKMGILRSLYALADLAFVGGSISPKGGHNALEPALFNLPSMMGPSIYNNPAINLALTEAGALKTVNTAHDIVVKSRYWLSNLEQKEKDGFAGGKVVKNNIGALEKTLAVLKL
ncbi:3-deoxy-D-manno-octulosonic acid transferase, partial [Paraglaciecola sp.]|uniref:3-deoxy-D-manno-octulosonic acid transferase n=1 Tax=Paraglaciecola sp. TaxID=1920173 RepID=UPI003EF5A77F